MPLSPADRERLVKVLRLLSSSHEGESSAAGRRAHEMLQRLGLDWAEVIGTTVERIVEREPEWSTVRDDDEADLVRQARTHEEELTDWEWEFLGSINEKLKRWGRLTPKQRAVLDRIIVKLKARGVW